MKRQLFHFLFVLLAIFAVQAQELTVCTYNVRYKNGDDTDAGNGWNTRRTYLINLVNFQQPDLLGVQEALPAQMIDLKNGLTDYGTIGVGRNDGANSGEYSAIFYRKERMVLIDHGDFWLSDTPYKPSKGFPSQGGGTSYYRICTWGKFYDKATGVTLFHFNTHMDLDETNRQQSFYLIKQKIQELASTTAPVIISGDYNAVQTGDAYKLFLNSGFLIDSYEKAKQKFMTNGTCPGFNSESYSTVSGQLRRIDHIFVTKNAFNVNHYAVLNPCYYSTSGTASYHLRAYSDHSPVLAKLAYKDAVPRTELPTTKPPIVDGVYQISTPEELQTFSFIVNGVAGFTQNQAAKAVLLGNIDMTGMPSWLPIGTSSKPFTGTFDGQGYSIENIAIKTSKSCSGFVGYATGATIKNFSISGKLTVSEGYTDHGVVGYSNGSTISDVHSSLDITATKSNNDTQHIGGVVGSMFNTSVVTRCSYAGKLTDAGTNTVGGIVGYADGTYNSITYCLNYGTVKSTGSETNIGGILGYVNHTGFRMSYCANVGTVTGSATHGGQIIGRQLKAMTTPPTSLYYLSGTTQEAFGSGTDAASATGATAVTEEDVVSGKLTFLLNDCQSEGSLSFYQNIDEGEQTDPYPVLYPGHKVVWQGQLGEQLSPEDETDYNFYVNEGGRLPNLGLVNAFSTPVTFTADHASYSCEQANTWGRAYLPFAVASTDNVQFYEVVPELSGGSVLAIAPCDSLQAYTPGFYSLADGSVFEVSAVDAPIAVPPTSNDTLNQLIFIGMLRSGTPTGSLYELNGDTFHLQESILVNPFEFYLAYDGGDWQQDITLLVVDATGIEELEGLSGLKDFNSAIYNLAGQRIGKAQKGIYIINGKKYIKK